MSSIIHVIQLECSYRISVSEYILEELINFFINKLAAYWQKLSVGREKKKEYISIIDWLQKTILYIIGSSRNFRFWHEPNYICCSLLTLKTIFYNHIQFYFPGTMCVNAYRLESKQDALRQDARYCFWVDKTFNLFPTCSIIHISGEEKFKNQLFVE